MARTEGRIKCAIWRDADFRGMSPSAQRAYFLILSQPGMSYCGVISYRPKPWSLLSPGTTATIIDKAVRELEKTRFVLVDRDTEELWVRTFVHHDGVLDQPKLIVAMAHDFATIESDLIRQGLVEGLPEGFLEGLPQRFPKANTQGLFQRLPIAFVEASYAHARPPHGRSPTPNPQPPTLLPAVPDQGQAILTAWYDESNPKPAQPWPAMLGVVRKMLGAGWSEDEVAWALRDAPAVSTAALTYSLKRRGKPNANGPAARSEEAMLAWLASEEANA